MSKEPSIPAPPGYTPFGDGDTLWKYTVLCISICLVCANIPFILRTYVRAFVRREWFFEDYMACLAWGGLVTYFGLITTVMKNHGGVHQWNLTDEEAQGAIYWFNIVSIEYGIEMLICKLTILMIYRRVFVPHRWNSFDIILRIFECVLIAFYFSITVVKIFACTPRARIWNRKLPGTCININSMLSTSGMFNFVTDVLLLLIPVKSVWNLKMKKVKKLRVVLVFTFGLIAPIFSLVGFLARSRLSHSRDSTYNQTLVLLWGSAEVSTGFICLCLPALSYFLYRRKQTNGPSQSIIAGNSNKLGSSSCKSKRKGDAMRLSDHDVLNSNYLELKDGRTYKVGLEKPKPTHVIGIVGGVSSDKGDADVEWPPNNRTGSTTEDQAEQIRKQSILKTVRIEQSYV